jgi:hypothetical protein
METNFIRLLAVLLLIPTAFLGLMPYIVANTNLLANFPEFTLEVFGTKLASLSHDINGDPVAENSWQVWAIAIVAEVGLLAASVLKANPVERKHKLTHRG